MSWDLIWDFLLILMGALIYSVFSMAVLAMGYLAYLLYKLFRDNFFDNFNKPDA